MPRPTLSSLISRFIYRESLSSEDKAAIRGDLGTGAALTNSLVLAHGSDPYSPNNGFQFRLSSPQDPGTPLNIDGRGAVIHGFSITGGSANFTNLTNHAHLIQQTQAGNWWQTFICGDYNSGDNRWLIYSRIPSASTVDYNRANLVSIDTRSIDPATPVSPLWMADGFILNYSNQVSLALDEAIDMVFSPGLAGFVGGRYPGKVTQVPTLVSGLWQVKVKLFYLTPNNFNVAAKALANVPLDSSNLKSVTLRKYQSSVIATQITAGALPGQLIATVSDINHGFEIGASIIVAVNDTISGFTGIGLGFHDSYVVGLPSETEIVLQVGSMISSGSFHPPLAGTYAGGNVSLISGNTDPVHQPTANMQTMMFERWPMTANGEQTSGIVKNFSIGPANECFGRNNFAIGFRNLVEGGASSVMGHRNNLLNCVGLTVVGNDISLVDLSNATVVGKGNNLISVSASGLQISSDGGANWQAGGETTSSILTKLEGSTPEANKIGEEYLPPALINLTLVEGDPNQIPNYITLADVISPYAPDGLKLYFRGMIGSYYGWTSDGDDWSITYADGPGEWVLQENTNGSLYATIGGDPTLPTLGIGWTIVSGAPQEYLALTFHTAGEYHGQLLQVASTAHWYQWSTATGTWTSLTTLLALNGAIIRPGLATPLNPSGLGYEIVCSALYVTLFLGGETYFLQQDGYTVRAVHNCLAEWDVTMDSNHGYVVGSRRTTDDGKVFVCVVAAPGAAIWERQIEASALPSSVPPTSGSFTAGLPEILSINLYGGGSTGDAVYLDWSFVIDAVEYNGTHSYTMPTVAGSEDEALVLQAELLALPFFAEHYDISVTGANVLLQRIIETDNITSFSFGYLISAAAQAEINRTQNGIPFVVTLQPTPLIDYIGQRCRVGDVEPYSWYVAETPFSWVPESGGIGEAVGPATTKYGRQDGAWSPIVDYPASEPPYDGQILIVEGELGNDGSAVLSGGATVTLHVAGQSNGQPFYQDATSEWDYSYDGMTYYLTYVPSAAQWDADGIPIGLSTGTAALSYTPQTAGDLAVYDGNVYANKGAAASPVWEQITGPRVPVAHTHSVVELTSGVLPVSMGGTGSSSASAARSNLGADNAANLVSGTVPLARIISAQTVGNANATIASSARDVLLTSALTAPRVYTWPLANAYPAGARVAFTDMLSTLTAVNTATLTRSGSNLINGGTDIVLNTPGASPILISDGVSRWNLDIRGISRGGTGATTAAGAWTNLGGGGTISSPTFSGNLGVSGNTTLAGITETTVALGTVVSSHTLAITSGTAITATLSPTPTVCAFAMPPIASGKSFALFLKQDPTTGGGNATFTGVKWPGGTAPTITPTAGKMDLLTFTCDGAVWCGAVSPNYTP